MTSNLQPVHRPIPFEIRSIEGVRASRQSPEMPHRHTFYEMAWITRGGGAYFADLEKYPAEAGAVYVISPGQVHRLVAADTTSGYVLSFDEEFLQPAAFSVFPFTKGRRLDRCAFMIKEPDIRIEVQALMEKLLKEFNRLSLLRAELLQGLFNVLLLYLGRSEGALRPEIAPSRRAELAGRFFALLDEQFIYKKKVTDYAEDLAVTPNYLNEIIKGTSGFPASHHIQQRIILEAKRQALYSDASMKEVAYGLGFDDMAHFSKFFKNVSGLSFTDFKKTMMGQQGYTTLPG